MLTCTPEPLHFLNQSLSIRLKLGQSNTYSLEFKSWVERRLKTEKMVGIYLIWGWGPDSCHHVTIPITPRFRTTGDTSALHVPKSGSLALLPDNEVWYLSVTFLCINEPGPISVVCIYRTLTQKVYVTN